ncbi:MAG: DUF192 domain-containing protein [Pseudomonadota bacterium]
MKALTASVALYFAAGAAFASCADDQVELRGEFGSARFTVEVADDGPERSQGLMNRASMPMSAGMLFVYPAPQRATFWMRNTLIPLDMIFADETGVVTHIHQNAVPLDETTIDGGTGVQFVLEINGGLAGPMGLEPGVELRHPLIDQADAAWKCE